MPLLPPRGRALLVAAVLILTAAGCDGSAAGTDEPTLDVLTLRNVPADPSLGLDEGFNPIYTQHYTFVSLRDQQVLTTKDSLATTWDLALRGTSILTNSGLSGPGDGGIQQVDLPFDEVRTAPAGGYAIDGASGPALTDASGSGWYTRDASTGLVTPVPNRTFILRTGNGRVAKVEFLSYYEGAPATPAAADVPRYYTIRYVVQPEAGSLVLW